MAHESFEDPEVASLLNENFICIKVDREERPDVDHIYMEACMALSGQGGWPLTAFLLPDRRVFHAGTYFPKHPTQGRHGMMSLLPVLTQFWKTRRDELISSAHTLREELVKHQNSEAIPPIDTRDRLDTALHQFSTRFDKEHGGFGGAPKFPVPHQYWLLSKLGSWLDDPLAHPMVHASLSAMARGGIRDHVGGGFHRYATDSNWLVPHFEKMLYDQALMMMAFAEAQNVTPDTHWLDAVEQTVQYVERDLALPTGGYACGEDADSDGVEGLFYFWTPDELREALGPEQGARAHSIFQVTTDGNFIAEHGISGNANILHYGNSWPQDEGRDLRTALLAHRSLRKRPARDEKILVDWNGLYAAALARCAFVFDRPDYLALAKANVAFTHQNIFLPGRRERRLFHSRVGLAAGLDDFACQIFALLEIHQSTLDESYLNQALELEDEATNLFWDENRGAYFMSREGEGGLPWRPLSFHDGALPSGNGLMAYNLSRLWRLTGAPGLETRARRAAEAPGTSLTRSPVSHVMSLLALFTLDAEAQDIVVAGENATACLPLLRRHPHPNRMVRMKVAQQSHGAPWMASMKPSERGVRIWVCDDRVCRLPIDNFDLLSEALAN